MMTLNVLVVIKLVLMRGAMVNVILVGMTRKSERAKVNSTWNHLTK